MAKIKLLSPAKINLTLGILGKRADGYHEISSIMQPVDLFDELTVDVCEPEGNGIGISSTGLRVPNNKENLAWRAAELYKERTGLKSDISIHINKKIPLGSGLGGGSGNAAAVLVGLNKLTGLLKEKDLLELAPRAGADVAFFISSVTSLAQGIGDRITLLKDFPLYHYVLICPHLSASTKSVYAEWDNINSDAPGGNNSGLLKPVPGTDEFRRSSGTLPIYNDLQLPAISLYPEIDAYIKVLKSMGAQNIQMTGSGSAVFAVFSESKEAEEIYEYLKTSPTFDVYLVRGIKGWHKLV